MKIITDWITDDTRNLLKIDYQNRKSNEIESEERMFFCEDNEKKLERYRWEYVRLCAKLNQEELEDEKYDQMILKKANTKKKGKSKVKSVIKTGEEELPDDNDENILMSKMSNFFGGTNVFNIETEQKKKVRFADEKDKNDPIDNDNEYLNNNETENRIKPNLSDDDDDLYLPLNYNQHTNSRRKLLFFDELKKFLTDILQYEINQEEMDQLLKQLKSLIDTFQLTLDNTPIGVKQNYFLAILLLRILLIFNLIDPEKLDPIFRANIFIVKILEKFNLTIDCIDNDIKEIFLR